MVNIAEFYNKLNEQERKVFYVAAAVLILALSDILFLRPVLSRIAQIEEEIHSMTLAIERDIRFVSYREKITAEDQLFTKYETGESRSGEEIIAGFLKTIEVIASEKKINLSRVTPSDVSEKKGFVQYFASVECSGKLTDMIAFMHAVDSTDNLLKIIRMNMTGNKASKEDVKVEMKIAKLVIDPATVGNYEFDAGQIKMPQKVLDEAAAAIGLSSAGGKMPGQKETAGRSGVSSSGSAESGPSGLESGSVSGSGSAEGGSSGRKSGSDGVSGSGSAKGGSLNRTSESGGGSGSSGGRPSGRKSGSEVSGSGADGAGFAGEGVSGSDSSRRQTFSSGQRNAAAGGVPGKSPVVEDERDEDLYLGGRRPKRRRKQEDVPSSEDVSSDEGAGSFRLNQKNARAKETQATKSRIPLDGLKKGGGRVRVDGLNALWGKFLGKIFGQKEELQPAGEGEYYEDQDYQEQDERNLWERKIQ